jgi:hypothetical protein
MMIAVLLVHMMVHPLAHAVSVPAAPSQAATIVDSSDPSGTLDQCGLCRVLVSLTMLVMLSLLSAPQSVRQPLACAVQAAYSLEFLTGLPSRAPPSAA